MAAASDRVVTVFGGTGFLGRRIVRHLRLYGFGVRVASRHPDRGHALLPADDPLLRLIKADVHDERSVAEALADAYGAVNAVSLYVEQGGETFHSVHVESAQRVAAQALRAGVKRFVHVSGIGANPRSRSRYIRKRGEGELAVRAVFPDAVIVRPAVMFGEDDGFLSVVLKLLRQLPFYPMFGRGLTRLQPVYVEDVAEAIARTAQQPEMRAMTFEFGGPRIYSYEELLRAVAREVGLRPTLVPMPFAAWHSLAWFSEMLPNPPVTRNQIELMEVDNVSSPKATGFKELGISPHSVEEILQDILRKH
jgi:uncharacterized protein YbjT (DUF2867 family)